MKLPELSPMLKQFYNLKAQHPDALLLFRCGDFYETYEEDAVAVSELIGITLTKSSSQVNANGTPLRMAGFPYHSLDTYLPLIIRAGRRVAISDQLEDPNTKKLQKRIITETITPKSTPVSEASASAQPKPSMKDIIIDYKNLCAEYAKASEAYYKADGNTLLEYTDEEFDKLQQSIRQLLEKFPDLINECNPFATPQDDHIDGFKKVKRTIPMLSLRDIYTREEVETWWNSVGNVPISVEAKLDGLSLSLIYKGGKLVQASTRGTGYEGDDVTAQALNIANIPNDLRMDTINTEIRGEVTMPIATFKAWNEQHPDNKLANPRNAASGALKTLDPNAVIEKGLRFNAYTMPTATILNTQNYVLEHLDNLGFETLPHQPYVATTLDEIMWAIENVQAQRNQYSMQIDGVVLKVNDLDTWATLGNTDKFHKFGIAFKFTHEASKSTLIAIDWQLSQDGSGRLSPVGIYDNIEMLGTNCHRVTMNNIDWINRHYPDIYIGDYLLLTKGGDIIPRTDGYDVNPNHLTSQHFDVVQSEKSEVGIVVRQTCGKVIEPTYCPKCGAMLEKKGAYLYCPNKCIGTNKEPKASKQTSQPITTPTYNAFPKGTSLSGKTFYITGKFYDDNGKHSPQRRKELQAMVVSNGGTCQDKFLASRCDYLVCGDDAGMAKVTSMQQYCKGDQVIDEAAFLDMIF